MRSFISGAAGIDQWANDGLLLLCRSSPTSGGWEMQDRHIATGQRTGHVNSQINKLTGNCNERVVFKFLSLW